MKIIAALLLILLLLAVLFYRRLRESLGRSAVFSLGAALSVMAGSFACHDLVNPRDAIQVPQIPRPSVQAEKSAATAVVEPGARRSVYALADKDLYRKVAPSVVLVVCTGKGYGTGFFFGPNGVVVTNHHVVQGATQAEIVTDRGRRYPVKGIVAEDPANDLVMLSTGIPSAELRGLTVNPFTDAGDRIVVVSRHKVIANVLSEGTVTALPVHPWMGIRLAKPLSYGASGSPVFNSRGEVVAIIRAGDQQDNHTGFAIPAARLTALAEKGPYPLSEIAASEPLDAHILVNASALGAAER
ncbi:MAG TPA: trypsin-like peptidase domain-containing protein [Syntrophales bacterium]|nr:trypsin-like peptidase domain-containing protein [Syntrophales bacterium]